MNEKEEEKMAQGFVDLMESRGISDRKAYFSYLEDQKRKKYDAAKGREEEALNEIEVLGKLQRGEL